MIWGGWAGEGDLFGKDGKILHGMRLENPKIHPGMRLKLKIPTWNEAPGIQSGSAVAFSPLVLGMSQGIWRIWLFHPRFCPIFGDKCGKRFHVGMPGWLFLRSPSTIFRWELWDWDRSGSKLFQLFNTEFSKPLPSPPALLFPGKKPHQK